MNPEPQMLVCYCCRERYQRGKFRCCAPPTDMKAHRWLELRCTVCKKCPRHCHCEKPEPEHAWPMDAKQTLSELAITAPPREWMPFKETE